MGNDRARKLGTSHPVPAQAGCASNVVLLGDQMQLPAPQRAAHPGELAGASALEYYSLGRGDGGSLPADLGVFLDVSRRLHPALCGAISELVYGGRLRAHADAAKRTVPGATALASADAGLVVVDVRAGQESEIPNFKGSSLGRFPLVSADFWTSDQLSERSRSVNAFPRTRARGTLTLKRR